LPAHGIDLDRSTLANWVGRACWWLRPLAELLQGSILCSSKIFADDTPVPVLDPGRGRTKTGRLWSYARDDRPWQGPLPPAVAYVYSENRQGAHPQSHLAAFTGVLQVDGGACPRAGHRPDPGAGFKALAGEQKERKQGAVQFAFCWAHVRRKFFDFHHATGSPIAAEALRRIAELYQIEARIRGRPPDERIRTRQTESRRLVEAMKTWLERELARLGEIRARRGDPVRAAPLERAQPLSGRRPRRTRLEHGRAHDPADQAWRQEPPLRRLRWRRRKLGCYRLIDPDRQAQRCRAVRLSARCPGTHRLGHDQSQRPKLAIALGLEGLTNSGGRQ